VQGDTTSTVAAAIAAFGHQIPIAHVEAGLRTFDLSKPFPEEAWRSLVGQIANLHFAPTERSAENLRRCGVSEQRVLVTGNTVIDALHWLLAHTPRSRIAERLALGRRIVLVTLHRRENWNGAFEDVCSALLTLRDRIADIEVLFVAHANPALKLEAQQRLAGQSRVQVLEPLDYATFIHLLRRSALVLSDSGGVQEEAPAFGVPVLVLRDTTERPEAIEEGVARLVGTNTALIVETAETLLTNEAAYRAMARAVSPFGDGKAAQRIAGAIAAYLASAGSRRPQKSAA
jgi:UDP-N-acetylglucosamine 2-epimerase (non-hydrolysing)